MLCFKEVSRCVKCSKKVSIECFKVFYGFLSRLQGNFKSVSELLQENFMIFFLVCMNVLIV